MPRISREQVLDPLSSLTAKSFVAYDTDAPGGGRYRMLETIREYAGDRLAESDETPGVRRRHAELFLTLAEAAQPYLASQEGPQWLDRLETEHDNMRSALGFCAEQPDSAKRLCLAAALWKFWALRWHLSEGRVFVEAALRAADGATQARAEAALGAGCLAWMQADYGAARTHLNESLALGSAARDQRMVAVSRLNLGNVAVCVGEYDLAYECYTACLGIGLQLGFPLAGVLHNLGDLARVRGDYSEARRFYDECFKTATGAGDESEIASTHNSLALTACLEGDDDEARSHMAEALTLAARSWDRRTIAEGLEVAAILAGRGGPPERAANLWGAAEAIREDLGTPLSPVRRELYGRLMPEGRGRMDEQAWASAWAVGRAMTADAAVALAHDAEARRRIEKEPAAVLCLLHKL